MRRVDVKESMVETVAFRLAKLGQLATARFAQRLAPLGLRPRHCAVLGLLAGPPLAQLELANNLGVSASVVVDMLDKLETLGAVQRIRDSDDRRRQLTELTDSGRTLSRRATRLAQQIDAELLGPLSAQEASAVRHALEMLARAQAVGAGPPGQPADPTPTPPIGSSGTSSRRRLKADRIDRHS